MLTVVRVKLVVKGVFFMHCVIFIFICTLYFYFKFFVQNNALDVLGTLFPNDSGHLSLTRLHLEVPIL